MNDTARKHSLKKNDDNSENENDNSVGIKIEQTNGTKRAKYSLILFF